MPVTGHRSDIKVHLQERLSRKFGDIEVFSGEHRDYIGKFSRLVESMQSGGEGTREKHAALQLEDTVGQFLEFIRERNFFLTEEETKKLQAITGSGFEPLVKKRMAEDFIHEVKQRFHRESLVQIEAKKREEEISRLRYSRLRIIDWFRITSFALSHDTVTPFRHRIRGSIFRDCYKRLEKIIESIIPWLEKNLNEKFYLLSNREYNALREVFKVAETLSRFVTVSWKESYSHAEIGSVMDILTRHYIATVRNSDAVERAIKILMAEDPDAAGIRGRLLFLMDKPLKNGRPARYSQRDYFTNTIVGLILSYYTVRRGIVVETLNQVVFLTDYNGQIDDTAKDLTKNAQERHSEHQQKEETEQNIFTKRLDDIKRVTDSFIEKGKEIEEKCARLEAKSKYQVYLQESEKRPLLRVKRLADAFIRYFSEPIFLGNDIPLFYDGREYKNYFDIHPSLVEKCREMTLEKLELIGTRLKDFLKGEIPDGMSPELYLRVLAGTGTSQGSEKAHFVFQRRVLQKISNAAIRIAEGIFEIIKNYEDHREVVYQSVQQNYNFFINASFRRSRQMMAPQLFGMEEMTLSEFLESACSFAYFIAYLLGNPSVTAFLIEEKELEEKLRLLEQRDISTALDIEPPGDEEENGVVLDELRKFYTDTLTGLNKKEYFEDVIFPRFYDSGGHYAGEKNRYAFMLELLDLPEVNRRYGHEMGNAVVRECVRLLSGAVSAAEGNGDNLVLRYQGPVFLGFLHTDSVTGAVEAILSLSRKLAETVVEREDETLAGIAAAAAVYSDHPSQVFDDVKNALQALLNFSHRKGAGKVAFMKNVDHLVTSREIDSRGDIHEDLVTVLE